MKKNGQTTLQETISLFSLLFLVFFFSVILYR